ncbi:MAG: hypothetical protein ACJ73D_00960 [Pyrinomonadaceae bacterium]
MKKKLAVLVLLLSSTFVFLPAMSNGADAQIRVQFGRTHHRHYHRGWEQRRGIAYNNYNYGRDYNYGRSGMVRQVYYVNGRRYVRWVRSY